MTLLLYRRMDESAFQKASDSLILKQYRGRSGKYCSSKKMFGITSDSVPVRFMMRGNDGGTSFYRFLVLGRSKRNDVRPGHAVFAERYVEYSALIRTYSAVRPVVRNIRFADPRRSRIITSHSGFASSA